MLKPLLVAVFTLGGCSSVGGPTDWLLPDEFTIGQGTQDLGGTFSDGVHDFALDGEQESAYAALTWDIPGIERSDGMSRETQRNMALLIDKMVEGETADFGGLVDIDAGISRLDKTKVPPVWLIVGVMGILAFLVLAAIKKSKRKTWR